MQRQQVDRVWAHPLEAIAFDMDGLLVNTEDLYTEVGQIVLERRGKEFTPELKRKIMGLPGPQAYEVMIQFLQLDDSADQLASESDEVFATLLPDRLALMPGIEALFDWIDQHEIPRCVATSSTRHFAIEVLSRVALLDRLAFVVTAADVPRGKPHPDIYLEAASKMQIKPENMLVLEDSQHGARAGVSSGACTVAIPGDHSQDHDFSGVFHRLEDASDDRLRTLLRAHG